MTDHFKHFDAFRRGLGSLDNEVIDELLAGRLDRRTFLRHGAMMGLALPVLGSMASLVGLGAAPAPALAQGRPGGTIRVAMSQPAGAIDPVTVSDVAGFTMLIQAGEFLCLTQPDLTLKPVLAESWTHNDDTSVWTFKLRSGVKFHSGGTMTAADVVATIDRLCDPANSSNALSAFKGILSKGNTKALDDLTVEFHLDAPYGSFPSVVSSDNYNCIILPASYKGDYEKNWDGTGPFRLEKFTPKVGASFVRNDAYWGSKALPDRTEFTYYDSLQPRILALQGGQADLIDQLPIISGRALINDPNISIIVEKGTAHQQVHMRCDAGPLADKRIRKALALSIDRKKLVAGLLQGFGEIGNDSPFAKAFPSTDPAVPQRERDIAQAKKLLGEAGVAPGLKVNLTTEEYLEIPQYAQLIQNFAREIGIDITLKIESQDAYYGKAVYGESDWLDSQMGITDYGNRGVPNVFLRAPLLSDGPWNGAHFKNAEYDKLVGQFGRTADIGGQRELAGKIGTLLLDETPIIFGYFFNYLVPTRKGVSGIPAIPDRLFLDRATLPG